MTPAALTAEILDVKGAFAALDASEVEALAARVAVTPGAVAEALWVEGSIHAACGNAAKADHFQALGDAAWAIAEKAVAS